MKEITGYPGYFVDIEGNIYSKKKSNNNQNGTLLKLKLDLKKCGYFYIGLYNDEGRKSMRVHRIVAQEFLNNPNHMTMINHINGNKLDNRLENLEWTNSSLNTKHAFKLGLAYNAKGYEDSQSRPVIVYDKHWNELFRCGSISEAARITGYCKSTIARQCINNPKEVRSRKNRKTYRFAYDDCFQKSNDYPMGGESPQQE
ncbi:MAG: HNH endonuclease [Turicibacter sp.]|nr:HNH endonuclease [Turicibacter sp.]